MGNNKIYYRLFLSFIFISVGLIVLINRAEGKTYILTINNIGNASGEVIISGKGISPPIRITTFPSKRSISTTDNIVFLRALNAPGSVFSGFTGCGAGVPYWPYNLPNYCTVDLRGDRTVNVSFTKKNIEDYQLCLPEQRCESLPPDTPMKCFNTNRIGNPGDCRGPGCPSGDLWSKYERKCIVVGKDAAGKDACERVWVWEKACAVTDKFNYRDKEGKNINNIGVCYPNAPHTNDCTVVQSAQQGATSQYSHLLTAGNCDCVKTGTVPYKICCEAKQQGNDWAWKPTPNLVAKGTNWSNLDDGQEPLEAFCRWPNQYGGNPAPFVTRCPEHLRVKVIGNGVVVAPAGADTRSGDGIKCDSGNIDCQENYRYTGKPGNHNIPTDINITAKERVPLSWKVPLYNIIPFTKPGQELFGCLSPESFIVSCGLLKDGRVTNIGIFFEFIRRFYDPLLRQ